MLPKEIGGFGLVGWVTDYKTAVCLAMANGKEISDYRFKISE